MVKDVALKEITQCQNCWRSRLEGARLSKCSGCQAAMYCSKECQKAAWPAHKTQCKTNSNWGAEIAELDQTGTIKRLRAYCSKHRPAVSQFGICAFDLKVDITRCLREVLLIRVRPNPNWESDNAPDASGGRSRNRKRAETAFIANDITVVPVENFGERVGEEMRVQLQGFHEEQRRVGYESGFMAVFCDISTGLTNAFGVGFARENLHQLEGTPQIWREPLLYALNSGHISRV